MEENRIRTRGGFASISYPPLSSIYLSAPSEDSLMGPGGEHAPAEGRALAFSIWVSVCASCCVVRLSTNSNKKLIKKDQPSRGDDGQLSEAVESEAAFNMKWETLSCESLQETADRCLLMMYLYRAVLTVKHLRLVTIAVPNSRGKLRPDSLSDI